MKEFEELDFDQIQELIEQKDADRIKELLADLHPADIAELCDELDVEEARFIYMQLDNETAAQVLTEMDEDARKDFLDILPSETIAKRFVDYMQISRQIYHFLNIDEENKVGGKLTVWFRSLLSLWGEPT